MIERIQIFLGPGRSRLLLLWLGGTGLISLILNVIVDQYDWVRPAQSIIVLIFMVGAVIIIGGRMRREDKLRWAAILAPGIVLIIIGAVFLPDLLPAFIGAALGWTVAGVFIFRSQAPMEYREAVKHLRKSEYAAAVAAMDRLINAEPEKPGHYRFRAEILRLWGKLGPARRDYKKMIELEPDSAVAYNGLAEVCLQAGDFAAAHEAGMRAYELAPGEWVAAYNLGMIEDRIRKSEDAINHLNAALRARVPETRHRLLVNLYLARAYARKGDLDTARQSVEAMRREKGGLDEWQLILGSDQAQALRMVLEEDVKTAQGLVDGDLDVTALAQQEAR